jgi:TolB-like protein/class 3 adenylate cyclase
MVEERPVRVERRLSAILAADVAGYSRLMHSDEEATHAKLTALLADAVDPAIAEHRGRVVKNTGDGFLAEFSSAVEAVRAAIQFQTRINELTIGDAEDRRIAFRVGVNIGDVIVEPHDIFGDGVNIAARLESIAEPGGICISSSVYDQVLGKITVEFADLGEQNLKNIARSIRAYAVVWHGHGPATRSGSSSGSSAPRLSIVVLPFANIGGDPEQEYFVDGVTESLTTDLSRISGSFVIARNSAFSYKGKLIDVRQVGRELNVRYALEGSVQRGGSRFRVNVQLIDAETGNHLWAERFDKPVADLFDVQDEIVSRLANTLNVELIKAEARRAERSLRPDAIDLYFQGRVFLSKGITPAVMVRARDYFMRALALDPDNVEAAVATAQVDLAIGSSSMADDGPAHFRAAEEVLSDVLLRAPNHPRAHMLLGAVQIRTGRATKGIAECRRALTLDRNLADAHGFIGLGKHALGRGDEVEGHIQEALRLSPRDTRIFLWFMIVGMAKLMANADLEALDWLRRSIEANPNFGLAHFHLAGTLAMTGDLKEARSSAEAGLALDPGFTIRRYDVSSFLSENPLWLARREHFYAGMRQAGVPEG